MNSPTTTDPEPGPQRAIGSHGRPPLLQVDDLRCHIPTPRGLLRAVDGVTLTLERGQTLGIAGESGSGKSILVRTIMGIAPRAAEISGGVHFGGVDLRALSVQKARTYLGRHIAMVFQDPMTALNPVVRIERHLIEGSRHHLGLSRTAARAKALELLEQVGIPEPRKRLRQYPHQLSGGMRQRVTIAMALACDPELLIADEATTALDVTVQKQILDLLQDIQRERNMAVIMVSHDLGVLAGRTDRIAVMYGGQVLEEAPTAALFARHRHQYTRALLSAIPDMAQPRHSLLHTIPGAPPDPVAHGSGCRFAPRCAAVLPCCTAEAPNLQPADDPGHRYACFAPAGPIPQEQP
ncbi:ABC transporter ATP-binding protein [Pseudonocardia sp. DSM 110487]|uniref:ABC transporter ATP-binding protein n=1 Tax=Pseudonocardia sp. DSM 110487 TaxID=2865833 RepID=UPI001C6A54B0|nr:ABC transporter ATP-binding protein [Pseudonocardia sp. DSM 110487]QYN39601.1 ABC transporter ATP-binding protein [Pseudonocardia sp. DSM 110487]